MGRKTTRDMLAAAGVIIPPGVSVRSAQAQEAIAAHASKTLAERQANFAAHPDRYRIAPDYGARKREGRKCDEVASSEIAEAMRLGWGVVSIAADMLGCSASAILDRMRVNQDIRAARVEGMRLGDDLWHRRAMEGIDAGNTQWAALYLRRREVEREIAERGTIYGPRSAAASAAVGSISGAVGDLDRDVRSVRELSDAEIMQVMAEWQSAQAAAGARMIEIEAGAVVDADVVDASAPPWDNPASDADAAATDGGRGE